MKTKAEIINEVASKYNSDNRGLDEYGDCTYYNPENGCKCAVGMYAAQDSPLLDPEFEYCAETAVKDIKENTGKSLDDCLVEEVQGHELQFWQDLQALHDHAINWDYKGLSVHGKVFVEELLEKWGNK